MEKEQLTPEASFDIINKAISNFKVNYKESSKVFILWGWMLSLASFSNFAILRILHAREAYNLMGPYSLGNWALFIGVGFLIQYLWLRNLKKVKRVYTHLDNSVNTIWRVSAFAFFVATAICIKLEIIPPPIMLLVAAIPTTITGRLLKFKPLVYGGVAFFTFSVVMTFVPEIYMALVNGVAIFIGYVIPGYMLKSAKE